MTVAVETEFLVEESASRRRLRPFHVVLAVAVAATWLWAPKLFVRLVELLAVSMMAGPPWWLTRLEELLASRLLARAVLSTARSWISSSANDLPSQAPAVPRRWWHNTRVRNWCRRASLRR